MKSVDEVSLVLDLCCFTLGIDESFHVLLHDSFKDMLVSFKIDISLHMYEFRQCMSENYGTIHLCSQQILVKQKENVSIQTEKTNAATKTTQVVRSNNILLY